MMPSGVGAAPKAPTSSDLGDPDLGFPLEQPEQGDVDCKDDTSKMPTSSAMTEVDMIFTGIRATPTPQLTGSMQSRAVKMHIVLLVN